MTTETECGRHGETLANRPTVVWVGAPDGDAHLKDPLPVSLRGTDIRLFVQSPWGAGQSAAATRARSAR